MQDAETIGPEFLPTFARYDYGDSGIRWCCIVSVNETVGIRSVVSWAPKTFHVSSGIETGGLRWQYIVNCHIF